MMTCSAACYFTDAISGALPRATSAGEVFPDMDSASDAERVTTLSAFSTFASVPRIIGRQAARLLTSSVRSVRAARA